MKEFDFLPSWYLRRTRRKKHYRSQCILAGGILIVIAALSFVCAANLSSAQAQCRKAESDLAFNQKMVDEYQKLQDKISKFSAQKKLLRSADSRIVVELSFLVDKTVVLRTVEITAQPFSEETSGSASAAFKAANAADGGNTDARYSVAINGIASDSGHVAKLIQKLEDSPYFVNVMPGYSRNKKSDDFMCSEFEISCYIANYKTD